MPTAELQTNPEVRSVEITSLFPGAVGFYFVFRDGLSFVFFKDDPATGTIVKIGIDLVFLLGAFLYSSHPDADRGHFLPRPQPIRWIFALLSLSLVTVLWTGAQSVIAAVAYWAGMASDVIIVLLILRGGDAARRAEGIIKGAVLGATALALVAWCSPLTDDLRLGNDEFLHPNTLGLDLGLATLLAQYLSPLGSRWKWISIALAFTLLRTLSKTAIIAFIIAECWYLMQNRQMSRKTKLGLVATTLVVVGSFWNLLNSYIDAYSSAGSGNQAETLTGRTVLWATAYSMSLERPWLGHGIYSFKSLIPAFGPFEPVHAHNEFLQQFFEYGAAGVVIAAGVYWSFYRLARGASISQLRSLALALLLFSLLRGLADTINFGLSFPLWLLTALSILLVLPAALEESVP